MEGGGIVIEAAAASGVGDGFLLAEAVVGEAQCGRAVGIGHAGQFASGGVVAVSRNHSPRPGAGGELSGGGDCSKNHGILD